MRSTVPAWSTSRCTDAVKRTFSSVIAPHRHARRSRIPRTVASPGADTASGMGARSVRRKVACLAVERRAQATVEAALLLPAFLTLLLLALQPICLLYTRAVMESAAAETARLMVTADEGDEEGCRSFALRRLSAVPDVEIFHAGGPLSWEIELSYAEAGAGRVAVSIAGAVSPLPVLGAFAGAFGSTNSQGDVVMEVEVAYEGRPAWLEGDYDAWTQVWN